MVDRVEGHAASEISADVVQALGLDGQHGELVPRGRVSKTWRCRKDGSDVAVRQSPSFRTLSEVRYEWDLLRSLHLAGAPVAAPLGEPEVVLGSVWAASAWVDATHPSSPVPDPAAYGRLLAELHRFTDDAARSLGQRPGWGRVDQFLTTPRAHGTLTLDAALPDFERSSGAVGLKLRRLAMEVHERLGGSDLDRLPHTIAHGDFGPHQVMFRAEGAGAIVIDWDFCHRDLRIADLAIGTSLARPTRERAAEMLAGYLAAVEVEPGDLQLVADLRRAFHLNSLANFVCAVWVNGIDISREVAAITERLDREHWWGPALIEAARLLTHEQSGARRRHHLGPGAAGLTDLEVAQTLADRAAVVAMHYYDRGVVTETKEDATPVTEADRAVELLLREGLAELRSDDAVLGEEFGSLGASDRTWILDPIDGTVWFARSDPNWRIHIALQAHDEIVVAVVYAPALGTRWWATAGGGAYEAPDDATGDARRLKVSEAREIRGSLVDCHPTAIADRLPAVIVPPAPTPLPLVELVRGQIDAFFVDCCRAWDHAPWILLVREAGGDFTDHLGGSAADQRGGLYSNGHLHDEMLAALVPPIIKLG